MGNAKKPYFRKEASCYAIRRGAQPGGPIKLGFSNQLHHRYKNLQLEFPELLKFLFVFPGTFHLEKKLHRAFASIRVSESCEWFHDPDPVNQEFFDAWCVKMHHDDLYRDGILSRITQENWTWEMIRELL